MEKEILYEYAEDIDGNIIHVDKAVTGINYCCPSCKEGFIFKNGKIRQRHFAHKNPSSNCTSEGYLHKTFKKLLVALIKDYISRKLPMEINWGCNICKNNHKENLLAGIIDAKGEYDMGVCRPDIALFNEKGNTPIVIEIVDTHPPEANAIEHYAKNGITPILVNVSSLNDLENVENIIKYSPIVFFFNRLLCPNYYRLYIQKLQNQNLYNSYILNNNYRQTPRRPTLRGSRIDAIEAAQAAKERKRHFAITSYYAKKNSKKH
ncbi:competence protein CoiA family protein [Treponema endosymbiont of Eucomonympha sp.]|uniref:competence protein CoiA family protein n=1 Tax=Treponema endosymbiont of Eucomonympha sp. TaxID=1580831 RepID=UPI000A4A7DEF|nr:competence protein CoiA family protein [Treponema endosymbiont of Eucomonympha sp.]